MEGANKMKLQVGDKVKLNDDVSAFRRICLPTRYMGEIVTVKKTRKGDAVPYTMKENGGWCFNDDTIGKIFPKKITNWKDRII